MGGIARSDVHYVLPNTASHTVRKVDRERALALIDVAHPNSERAAGGGQAPGLVLPSSTWLAGAYPCMRSVRSNSRTGRVLIRPARAPSRVTVQSVAVSAEPVTARLASACLPETAAELLNRNPRRGAAGRIRPRRRS